MVYAAIARAYPEGSAAPLLTAQERTNTAQQTRSANPIYRLPWNAKARAIVIHAQEACAAGAHVWNAARTATAPMQERHAQAATYAKSPKRLRALISQQYP